MNQSVGSFNFGDPFNFVFHFFRLAFTPLKLRMPQYDQPIQLASSPVMDLGFLNRVPLVHGQDLSGFHRSKIIGKTFIEAPFPLIAKPTHKLAWGTA